MAEYNTRIKLKRDTSANWTARNPVLLNGEVIIVDTADGGVRKKVGDGVKTYTQLPFDDEDIYNTITEECDLSKYFEISDTPLENPNKIWLKPVTEAGLG